MALIDTLRAYQRVQPAGQTVTAREFVDAQLRLEVAIASILGVLRAMGASSDTAGYLCGAADASVTSERVVTDTATVTWDVATANLAKANVPNSGITYAKIQNVSATDKVLGRSTAGAGVVEEIACTAAGRALIDDADAAAQRTTLGLGTLATTSNLTGPITSVGAATAVAAQTGTGTTFVMQATPTLTTPVIGVATGTSLAVTGLLKSSSATAGVGYATGAGNTITQQTSKATGVTINAACGQITMNNASLAAGGTVVFTVTNSAIATTDCVLINHDSVGTIGNYLMWAANITATTFDIVVRNQSGSPATDAVVINFAIIKAVTS